MKSFLVLAALALLSVSAVAQTAPTVTINPASQTVVSGSSATFVAAASGDPAPTVQWQVSPNSSGAFTDISGATSTTLTFTTALADSGKRYQAVFTNASGTATTSAATLTVTANLPNITTQPANLSRTSGQTATFSATATNFTSVIWQNRASSTGTFTNMPSSSVTTSGSTTSISFTAFSSLNGSQYRAIFTSADGSVTSNTATLTVTSSTDPTPDPDPTPTPGVNTTGVLIYELSFKHTEGFNVDFWDEGYIIVPAVGGEGSALFTATDNGRRTFRSFSSSVSFFNAKDKHHSYSVMAMAGTSPSIVCIHAYGRADDKLKANGPNYSITVRAADTLKGMAQASRDESTLALTDQPRDGTLGFLEFAEVKATLDQSLTDLANEDASSVESMFDYLKKVLTRRGFVEEADTTDDGTTDDGTTDGTTTDDTTSTTTTTTN